jgi:hypothetical protein
VLLLLLLPAMRLDWMFQECQHAPHHAFPPYEYTEHQQQHHLKGHVSFSPLQLMPLLLLLLPLLQQLLPLKPQVLLPVMMNGAPSLSLFPVLYHKLLLLLLLILLPLYPLPLLLLPVRVVPSPVLSVDAQPAAAAHHHSPPAPPAPECPPYWHMMT